MSLSPQFTLMKVKLENINEDEDGWGCVNGAELETHPHSPPADAGWAQGPLLGEIQPGSREVHSKRLVLHRDSAHVSVIATCLMLCIR